MAKKTTKKNEEPTKKNEKTGTKYVFPSVVNCPRCNAADTIAILTEGNEQVRRCIRAICREEFTIPGKKS